MPSRFEYPPIWVPRPEGQIWLNENQRFHHHKKRPITKAWRETAAIHANLTTSRPFPKPARIVAFITYDSRRRYDPNNLSSTTKPCIDGFVDAGLIPDDDYHHVIGPDHRHHGVDKHAPGILFVITEYHPDHDWRPNR